LLPPTFQAGTLPTEVEPDDRLSEGLETTGWVAVTGAATTGACAGAGAGFVSVFDVTTGVGAWAGVGALTITGAGATTGVTTLVALPCDEPVGCGLDGCGLDGGVGVVCVGVAGVWVDGAFGRTTGVVTVVGTVTAGVVVEVLTRCGESLELPCCVAPVPLELPVPPELPEPLEPPEPLWPPALCPVDFFVSVLSVALVSPGEVCGAAG
jgi:hypothetical protein